MIDNGNGTPTPETPEPPGPPRAEPSKTRRRLDRIRRNVDLPPRPPAPDADADRKASGDDEESHTQPIVGSRHSSESEIFTPADSGTKTLLHIDADTGATYEPSQEDRTLLRIKDGASFTPPDASTTLFDTNPDDLRNAANEAGPESAEEAAKGAGESPGAHSSSISAEDLSATISRLPAAITPPLDARTLIRVRLPDGTPGHGHGSTPPANETGSASGDAFGSETSDPADDSAHTTSRLARIDTILKLARDAQREWELRPTAERAKLVDGLRFRLFENRLAIIDACDKQLAHTEFETLTVQLLGACDLIREYTRLAPEVLAPHERWTDQFLFRGRRIEIWRAPWGIVGLIASSEFPVAEMCRIVAAALIGGNAVVIAPTIGDEVGEALRELLDTDALGLPKGLIHLMPADENARAALASAAVDHLVVSGDPGHIRQELAARAHALAGTTVHLHGAPAPMIVFADADIEAAAKAAVTSAFRLIGRAPESVGRVYVAESVAEQFCEFAAKGCAETKLGKLAGGFEVGPLPSTADLDRAENLIADAVAAGAKLLAGGRRLRGVKAPYLHPGLLTNCSDRMRLVWEHVAPILPVIPVPEPHLESHVQTVVNCLPVQMAAIWTADMGRARRLASRLQAGVFAVNDEPRPFIDPRVPVPAARGLGFGTVYGPEGLLEMTRPVVITLDDNSLRFKPFWFPFDHDKLDLARTLLKMRHSRRLRDRLSAWVRLMLHPNLRRILRGEPLGGRQDKGWLGLGIFSFKFLRPKTYQSAAHEARFERADSSDEAEKLPPLTVTKSTAIIAPAPPDDDAQPDAPAHAEPPSDDDFAAELPDLRESADGEAGGESRGDDEPEREQP